MKVFVAGGSGVIGRQLLPQLVAAGHQVTATTRKLENGEKLRSPGATPAVLDATVEGERLTLGTEGVEGVVLRYGALYGPGTYLAPDGDLARQARRRMLAIVGSGRGVFSFVHVKDAAVGARRQLSLPRWAATLMAGGWAVESLTEGRGASNARAKAELGWRPRYPSCLDKWREWEAQASRKTFPV